MVQTFFGSLRFYCHIWYNYFWVFKLRISHKLSSSSCLSNWLILSVSTFYLSYFYHKLLFHFRIVFKQNFCWWWAVIKTGLNFDWLFYLIFMKSRIIILILQSFLNQNLTSLIKLISCSTSANNHRFTRTNCLWWLPNNRVSIRTSIWSSGGLWFVLLFD